MDLKEAIRIALREVKDPTGLTYLKAMGLAVEEYGQEGLSWQLAYALLNMGQWKGEEARMVKGVFRQTIKRLDWEKKAREKEGGKKRRKGFLM